MSNSPATPKKSTVGLFFSPEEDLSLADRVAMMSEAEREEILSSVSAEELQWDSDFWLRPSQLALVNSSHWMTVALAGRGWGKTHVLTTAIHKYAMEHPGSRLLLLGRTTSDVRDVMILGSSGIMSLTNPDESPTYNPATRRLTWKNGSSALCYSAERPDALRGIQTHASFCDEVAAYRTNAGAGLANAFDQVQIATRLGEKPQIFVATTPKRVPMIVDLVERAEREKDRILIVRGPTNANRALSDSYKETVEGLYAGTALGRQELDGELLTDVDGALLHQDVIDGSRYLPKHDSWWEELPHRAVGVDPSVSATPNDECGIVVIGATGERKMYQRKGYVIEDASMLGSPDKWAKRAVEMARKYRAVIVAEKNQGGEMVRLVIQAEDPHVPVILVTAKVGKMQRAEPVGTAYERGSIAHAGVFPELEAQLTGWAPDMGMGSPDRMDALVHAATALLVVKGKGAFGRVTVAGNPSAERIDVKDHNPADRQAYRGGFGRVFPGKPQFVPSERLDIGTRNPLHPGGGTYTAPNRFTR